MQFLQNYYLDNTNNFLQMILLTFITVMLSIYCFNNKVIEDKNEHIQTEVSDSMSTSTEKDEVISTTSEDQYTSILYKSFLLMTKKQLLKITGNKYKNVNKDELIIIAINKFILLSIKNFKLIPVDTKMYVKDNKEIMKDELFKLYNVKSKNEKEYIKDTINEEECEIEYESESNSESDSDN
jgi:hypothetical protein